MDVLHLIFNLEWISDLDIGLVGPPYGSINLGVKGLSLKTELNVCLNGFTDELPFLNGIGVYPSNSLESYGR